MTQPQRWQWNEHEDAALHELQDHRAGMLYLRGLRKHMDYDTGIVGIKRRISERMLIELLEERRDPGSPFPLRVPTRSAVRWAIERLERVGLVERMPKTHKLSPMVFRLPLATIGVLLQPKLQPEATANKTEENPLQNNQLENSSSQSEQPKQRPNKYPPCPHQAILQIWDEVMPGHIRRPRAALWQPDRAAYKDLSARWAKCFSIIHSVKQAPLYHDEATGVEWWRGFFTYCTKSTFLMETCRPFELPWVLKKENFIKIQEGKFHDARPS